MMLHLNYDITKLRGAEYNPRFIGDSDLARLAESIKELGLVKPLIVRGDLLVAGHQRTKALQRLGVTNAAVYALPCETTVYDEIRFNQLHNGTDFDSGDERCVITGLNNQLGFTQVSPERISGNRRAKMAYVRKNIAELILKYGGWGGCVATQSGEVIHCAQYALASLSVRSRLTVFVIRDEDREKYRQFLNKKYGVFEYDHLEKTTYIQTYAQMNRLRNQGNIRSELYDNFVIPTARKAERGIDFGSGQGDYARLMRGWGYNLNDLELFRRKGGFNTLDTHATNEMIDKLVADISTHGRYDYVICDSVLNSVDSLKAETAVLQFVKALCKPGGSIYLSGRSREYGDKVMEMSVAASRQSRLVFLDDNGFSAQYRKGHWFYQKFHSKADVRQACKDYGFKITAQDFDTEGWHLMAKNDASLSWDAVKSAIEFEFELPLPAGGKIGRSADVLRAFKKALNK